MDKKYRVIKEMHRISKMKVILLLLLEILPYTTGQGYFIS